MSTPLVKGPQMVSIQIVREGLGRVRADVVLNVSEGAEEHIVNALCGAAVAVARPLMDLAHESPDGHTNCISSCPASVRQTQNPGEGMTK